MDKHVLLQHLLSLIDGLSKYIAMFHFHFFIFIYLSRVIHSVIKEKLIYNVPCLKNLC